LNTLEVRNCAEEDTERKPESTEGSEELCQEGIEQVHRGAQKRTLVEFRKKKQITERSSMEALQEGIERALDALRTLSVEFS
jgi:hypothetical protein